MANYTVTPQTAAVADCLKALKRFEDAYLIAASNFYGEERGDAEYKALAGLLVPVHDLVEQLLAESVSEALDDRDANAI